MNSVCRDIFKAIHEGKWLKIEYRNRDSQITKYWIGIRDLDPRRRTLKVDGLHLGQYSIGEYDRIYIDSILSSEIVEGSYCPENKLLIEDIAIHPERYSGVFASSANLKILSYLELCNRMDTTPYITDYELVHFLDRDSFGEEEYELSEEQFRQIVANFQYQMDRRKKKNGPLHIQRLAMNVLSIHTAKGLFVLAYRNLNLDVKKRCLKPDEDITICTQFTLAGEQQNIRRYLDGEEYELLEDFERNQEKIKDAITAHNREKLHVDDMPYVIGLGMEVMLNLHEEYKAILDMYESDQVTYPIRAFFGDLLERPRRSKAYPLALINQNVNLDQLLAINNAMKYPLAYIQGPPGTGKTNTIINTIVTAFFNNRSVLFASYNNVPIDNVFEKLSTMTYQGRTIPFPVLRLGNIDKVKQAIKYIQNLRNQVRMLTIFESTLDRRKDDKIDRAKELSKLLHEYEEILDLKERRETLEHVIEYQEKMKHAMALMPFQMDLQGHQLQKINERIAQIGEISDGDAWKLLDRNEEEFFQYLYYTSAKFIQQLEGNRYADLRKILDDDEDANKQATAFNKYLKKSENVKKLQKIFPIIITTCISAHKIGEPEALFDMTIMDEASQCNVAISLVPILRGEQLMLVGDPQQLNPVILLDELTNRKLRRKYHVADEYDYRMNSIYKTYLACDAVSDEVLLRNHYRCNKKIIDFNNQKYYNSKLCVKSQSSEEQPLLYVDVTGGSNDMKNTSAAEVAHILEYAQLNRDKSIAVVTPFVNQRTLIEEEIKKKNLDNLVCGTVHAFQGDEKDVVLFSTALSERTKDGTYRWLKNNKELINVATSRAKEKLIVLANGKELERLHQDGDDDLYELVKYIQTNGASQVTQKHVSSRALGVQPFSVATETVFMENLTHALENIWLSQSKYAIHKGVEIGEVFGEGLKQASKGANVDAEALFGEGLKQASKGANVDAEAFSSVGTKDAGRRNRQVSEFSLYDEFLEELHSEIPMNRGSIEPAVNQNCSYRDLFYGDKFDFVVYEKQGRSKVPILAIELDGKEHYEDDAVRERDRRKQELCQAHNLQVIRVENSYARRYNHIKEILLDYFSRTH